MKLDVAITIVLAVLGMMLVERIWQDSRRRRRLRMADQPIEECTSASGKFKAVAYEIADGVFRVELLFKDDPTAPYWCRTGPVSFVERAALAAVLDETLRAASGERS